MYAWVFRIQLFLLPLVVVSLPAAADALYVPTAEYPTIQSAIDAAVNGDEVIVADGTYTGDGNRDISFLGKAITVRSANGPSACIIDCQGSYSDLHQAFLFNSGETSESVVQGFTIRNGMTELGGAIYCGTGSWPTITGCVFENNVAWGSTLAIGGAIRTRSSSVTIINCTFTGNEATVTGGAIHCSWGSPTISNNVIIGNESRLGSGGGLYLEFTTGAVVSGNLIMGNVTRDSYACSGGGICLDECADTEVSGNVIAGNTGWRGGGVYCRETTADFFNNTIADNSAEEHG